MLTKLFYSRTVASITASLSSMVKDLEQHAEAKLVEYGAHNESVDHYKNLRELAQDEITKAKAAASKIAALFS